MAKKAGTKTAARKKATSKGGSRRPTAAKSAPPKPKAKSAAKPSAGKSAKRGTTKPAAAAKKATQKTGQKISKKTAKTPARSGKKPTTPAKAPAKAASKPSASKPAAKPGSKTAGKTPAKAPSNGHVPHPAPDTSKVAPEAEGAADRASTSATQNGDSAGGKTARKGITIVNKKPTRRVSRPKAPAQLPRTEPLLGDGTIRKPLIPSGPSASPNGPAAVAAPTGRVRSAFNEKQLQEFRDRLLIKRAELLGDISTMEAEALLSNSGNLSRMPSHIGDQGSDSFEQTVTLNLAAADRRLLREIDDALQRIADGVYGACEISGKPIGLARLRELPWTRYSIEAALELESRTN